ncbi:related to exodeoxyribonuclease 1 [Rhynchosporium graminicola]|uniref:Related to exodeoxyribonuclease 1 n=1 Tax=Rhynchosporium graminicola TaxID=2792576 RepID=A0A1E1KTP2_9HELO|nr:related to exodeoxyribonuclease 1 [Rhynchosporium commune]
MGINGLLPLLKSIHKSCNLRKFEGKTLGVDAYGWLHRGTVACAMELAMGKPTKKFVEFAMHRVRMLQHFGVIPFIIFDGDYLPSKAATEADREKRREQSRKAGMELLNAGKTSQAYLEFQKSVDVTPEMARQLIDELKRTGVQYIVAPYEADAQMVYLERKGIIDGILSEDSDLLVFGAKCLLTKLDQYGNCVEINKADFSACKEITLTGWSDREFRTMAILSGCDYLASINNMGLKTAYRMVRKHKTIEKVIRMLSFDGKFHVPKTYLEQFRQAEFTFLHQRVFCPQARTLVLHTTPEQPLDLDKMPFLGADIEPGIAQGVARGDLNPMTKKPIVNHTRNNMVTSMDPWATSRPRNNKPSPLDLMKGVPISTFFKKRIPLAELPLNMLTGSPEQQDLLRRNSGPWIAQAAPSTTLNISTTSPQFPQSAPLISRSQPANHRTTRAPTISEPRPPKRARLCADIDTALSPSKEAELGPSRFFNAVPEPSPSVSRNARGKKAKKQDFNIFSDDGIEEAMLSLANVDDDSANGKASGKKIAVFAEMVTARSEALTIFDDHGCEMDKAEPRGCTPGMTLSESSSSSFSQPPTPTSPCQIPNSMSKLKEQFSFGGAAAVTPKGTGNLAFPPTPASSVSRRQSRIPLPVKIAATTPKLPAVSALVTRKPLTPLQRLGATAASRTNLPGTPPMTPATLPLKVRFPHRSLLGKCSIPFPEAVEAGKENATNPASVPLPVADDMEKNLLSMGAGSEDFIIHESEDDSDISLGAGETGTKSRFDFGRFIYSA